ncbi:MAG: hypothetical protein H0T46_13845 [Deltaproteobacteria bacterium]|nr:hypothetical protein [Deltaproteobacteria bacterium]
MQENNRIGRRLAHGRFELTEWIGADFLMGISIGRDVQQGGFVRLTFAGDVSRSADELRPILTRDRPGLAPVVYLGPTAADDRWAPNSTMMAEVLPPGEPLDVDSQAGNEETIAAFGARLASHVARVHRAGTVLGTLRPESTIVTATGDVVLLGRGERLWLMPRPNMTKPAMALPWRGGYRAPEIMMTPLLVDPAPAADVFSIGVILATWLLGRFAYPGDNDFQVFMAQSQGNHVPLPKTPLGDILTRCLLPHPQARPSLVELENALRSN